MVWRRYFLIQGEKLKIQSMDSVFNLKAWNEDAKGKIWISPHLPILFFILILIIRWFHLIDFIGVQYDWSKTRNTLQIHKVLRNAWSDSRKRISQCWLLICVESQQMKMWREKILNFTFVHTVAKKFRLAAA